LLILLILNKKNKNKINIEYIIKMPYFIITAGATGSGKTGLINKTMEYLNISDQSFTT